jgi:hypothetical protein
LNDVFTFLTEVGNAGRVVNTGTSSYRGPSIDACHKVSDHLASGFRGEDF